MSRKCPRVTVTWSSRTSASATNSRPGTFTTLRMRWRDRPPEPNTAKRMVSAVEVARATARPCTAARVEVASISRRSR